MALTDPIADMLTILRNGSSAKKKIVEVKNSLLSQKIIKILKDHGFIAAYKVIKDSKQGILRVYMSYDKDGTPAISGITRISKPGLRIYKGRDGLPRVYGGIGVAIVSTSKGLLTDDEARNQKIGGEVICQIW